MIRFLTPLPPVYKYHLKTKIKREVEENINQKINVE